MSWTCLAHVRIATLKNDLTFSIPYPASSPASSSRNALINVVVQCPAVLTIRVPKFPSGGEAKKMGMYSDGDNDHVPSSLKRDFTVPLVAVGSSSSAPVLKVSWYSVSRSSLLSRRSTRRKVTRGVFSMEKSGGKSSSGNRGDMGERYSFCGHALSKYGFSV